LFLKHTLSLKQLACSNHCALQFEEEQKIFAILEPIYTE